MSIGKLFSSVLLVKSFVFGTLILGVWVRSYFVADTIHVSVGESGTSVSAAKGVIVYRAVADGSNNIRLETMKRQYLTREPAELIASLPGDGLESATLGFSYDRRPLYASGTGLAMTITIPLWLFFLLGSSKAIIWSARRYVRHATAPPVQFTWCVQCQCEQAYQASQCSRCGSPVAA